MRHLRGRARPHDRGVVRADRGVRPCGRAPPSLPLCPLPTVVPVDRHGGEVVAPVDGAAAERSGTEMADETKQDPENILEDVKGKAKEIVGDITGDEDMKQEGEAQQDEAEALDEAAQKRAEAEEAEEEAARREAERRAHED